MLVVACGTRRQDSPSPGAEGGAPATERLERGTVTLVFAGDAMFDDGVEAEMSATDPSYHSVLAPVRSFVAPAGLAMLNLETVVGAESTPIDKAFTFNSDPAALEAAAWAGFDGVNLANNHVLDFGAAGLSSTLAHLQELGMFEIGLQQADAPQVPFVLETGGLRIGLLGYADAAEGYAYAAEFVDFAVRPAPAEETAIARDVAALATMTDVLVVSVHWGVENQREITPRQRQLGHFLIEQGVDVVVGHHPHVQQELEWYSGGLILYSLGNFVFGRWALPEHLEGRLVRVDVAKGRVEKADVLELRTDPESWVPTPLSTEWTAVE